MPPPSPPQLDVLQNMFGRVVRSVSSAPEAAWENVELGAWTWRMQERLCEIHRGQECEAAGEDKLKAVLSDTSSNALQGSNWWRHTSTHSRE